MVNNKQVNIKQVNNKQASKINTLFVIIAIIVFVGGIIGTTIYDNIQSKKNIAIETADDFYFCYYFHDRENNAAFSLPYGYVVKETPGTTYDAEFRNIYTGGNILYTNLSTEIYDIDYNDAGHAQLVEMLSAIDDEYLNSVYGENSEIAKSELSKAPIREVEQYNGIEYAAIKLTIDYDILLPEDETPTTVTYYGEIYCTVRDGRVITFTFSSLVDDMAEDIEYVLESMSLGA